MEKKTLEECTATLSLEERERHLENYVKRRRDLPHALFSDIIPLVKKVHPNKPFMN